MICTMIDAVGKYELQDAINRHLSMPHMEDKIVKVVSMSVTQDGDHYVAFIIWCWE